MEQFPEVVDRVLRKISDEAHFRLHKNTHYDALNRELRWLKRNIQTRLNFEFDGNSLITVTLYRDEFSCCPRFFIWLHNNVPMFPYLAKINFKKLGSLPCKEREEFYYDALKSYVAHAGGQGS